MYISVIVATRDRAASLAALLESGEKLQPAGDLEWELIVVDNGSRDTTPALLEAWSGRDGLPLIALTEPAPGKPRALNRALTVARGDVIAFTDDDCILPPGWLDDIRAVFDADPALDGFGGRVELHDAGDAALTTRSGRERVLLTSPRRQFTLLIGCNMALRRHCLDALGRFDPLVGPGAPVGSGNDADIVYRAFRAGYRLSYEPGVVVYHHHGRRSEADIAALRQRYLRGRGGFYYKFIRRGDGLALRMAAAELSKILRRMAGAALRGGETATYRQDLAWLLAGFGDRRRAEHAQSQAERGNAAGPGS
jgi:glycosyltransferase involved in cell wall biosynthesis